MSGPLHLGLDIGGSSTKAVLLAADGTRVSSYAIATDTSGPGGLLATVDEVLQEMRPSAALASVGVGVPGLVDTQGGVRYAGNLGIGATPVDLAARLTDLTGVSCTVLNDANAAALGAFALVAPPATRSLACLCIGTGVAAGVVLDGRLWPGSRGLAGEIGHLVRDPEGAPCACGQRGCLETVLSGAALRRAAAPDDAGTLLAAARSGDHQARSTVTTWVGHLAWALELLALSVDVDVLVISGGVTDAGPPLLESVRERLGQNSSTILRGHAPLQDRTFLAPPHLLTGAVGAAQAGRDSLSHGLHSQRASA